MRRPEDHPGLLSLGSSSEDTVMIAIAHSPLQSSLSRGQ